MNDEMQDIFSDFLAETSEMLEALDQNLVKLKWRKGVQGKAM